MAVPQLPFQGFIPMAPFADEVPRLFSGVRDPELLWAVLRSRSDIAENGRTLFAGTLPQRNALWKQFRNLVRQGRSYYTAAAAVSDSSSALLYYYAFLNLAKAELLRSARANAILLPGVRHGLLFRPATAGGLFSGSVEVTDGVFPLLYESRTGARLRAGDRIPIRRLLAVIPEVGWEVQEAGFGASSNAGLISTIFFDATSMWGTILLHPGELIRARPDLRTTLEATFEEVAPQSFDWRTTLAVSRRSAGEISVWKERVALQRTVTPGVAYDDLNAICRRIWAHLRPHIAIAMEPGWDAVVVPSLYRSRTLNMPPSLARYAVMFYLSSVVRYRPELLDERDFAREAWLSDRIPKETAVPLLLDAVSEIERRPHVFASAAGLARA